MRAVGLDVAGLAAAPTCLLGAARGGSTTAATTIGASSTAGDLEVPNLQRANSPSSRKCSASNSESNHGRNAGGWHEQIRTVEHLAADGACLVFVRAVSLDVAGLAAAPTCLLGATRGGSTTAATTAAAGSTAHHLEVPNLRRRARW